MMAFSRELTRQHYENYLAWRQRRGDLDKLAGGIARGAVDPLFRPAGRLINQLARYLSRR
jgi:hypothetical protein